MCGVTTGGQEECYWDCNVYFEQFYLDPYPGPYLLYILVIENVECLRDCFPVNPAPTDYGYCATTLLESIIDGSIDTCAGGSYEYLFEPKCIDFLRTQPDFILNTLILFKLLPCTCPSPFLPPILPTPAIGTFNFFQFVCYFSPKVPNQVPCQCYEGFCTGTIPEEDLCFMRSNVASGGKLGQRGQGGEQKTGYKPRRGGKRKQGSRQRRGGQQRRGSQHKQRIGGQKRQDNQQNRDDFHRRGNNYPKREQYQVGSHITPTVPRIGVNSIVFPNGIKTNINYNNTIHRYPWICSLRLSSINGDHLCTVNLLQVPPGLTVIVGAAHCTYLCKDSSSKRIVDSCCCSSRTENCTHTNVACGNDPKPFDMEPRDAFIICGEWETGSDLKGNSEEYNVGFEVIEIARHPNFNIAKGSAGGSDLAIFKVDDSKLNSFPGFDVSMGVFDVEGQQVLLYPGCLPSKQNDYPTRGFHSSWSKPPPLRYLDNNANTKDYSDFYKQWHVALDIVGTCQDPTLSSVDGSPLEYPINTSYPAGVICAKDIKLATCFANGDSGGPLMVKEDVRFNIEGILSFNKGCNDVAINRFGDDAWALQYRNNNPSAYTKLSCFMSWIAEQYDMEYEGGENGEECKVGTGDKTTENNKENCRTNSVSGEISEAKCIFPFYYEGKLYEECILLVDEGFTYQTFRCPIRNITSKINGTNSFTFDTAFKALCSVDGSTDSDVDADIVVCLAERVRNAFQTCTNNCPGVRAFGFVGGGSLLAAAASYTSSAILQTGLWALGGLGMFGAATGMFGSSMLSSQQVQTCPPNTCQIGNQCCALFFTPNGFQCPNSC